MSTSHGAFVSVFKIITDMQLVYKLMKVGCIWVCVGLVVITDCDVIQAEDDRRKIHIKVLYCSDSSH